MPVYSHPRDVAIAAIHRDGSRWRYDLATVASRDPRVTAWRSAATGDAHTGLGATAPVVTSHSGQIHVDGQWNFLVDPKTAALQPHASRFKRGEFRTRRAHNQR